ncbi:hypothetical protein [Paractinoplanes atraurantiacus]|uniref:Uncharacterized protein n=1 Tax=Paractinoplanes atraurantiacus TaxID=1036182 RepID=A0A285KE46_9ACTN|nr:hypothetical protein [Actinoplanes atraurantiacus]SNY70858.1 hypothetical protein SAMN05421748_13874 [Actinoplanes atraurantiacus]
MTETGWPLIPREVLPAPVPAAKRRPPPRPPGQTSEAGRQLPIFGAGTTEPSPGDLAGLLAGPGRLGRMGGTARVSVVVDAAWRVHVLAAELVSRGLVVNWRPVETTETDKSGEPGTTAQETGDDQPTEAQITEVDDPPEPRPRFEVLTAYSRRLNGLAQAWPEAAAELFLSGPRLRLWVAAAGEPVPGGYALGLDPEKDATEIDAALVRAGLAGRLSEDGRQYLIKGKRRVARLAELVGERPPAAPEDLWPRGAAA